MSNIKTTSEITQEYREHIRNAKTFELIKKRDDFANKTFISCDSEIYFLERLLHFDCLNKDGIERVECRISELRGKNSNGGGEE